MRSRQARAWHSRRGPAGSKRSQSHSSGPPTPGAPCAARRCCSQVPRLLAAAPRPRAGGASTAALQLLHQTHVSRNTAHRTAPAHSAAARRRGVRLADILGSHAGRGPGGRPRGVHGGPRLPTVRYNPCAPARMRREVFKMRRPEALRSARVSAGAGCRARLLARLPQRAAGTQGALRAGFPDHATGVQVVGSFPCKRERPELSKAATSAPPKRPRAGTWRGRESACTRDHLGHTRWQHTTQCSAFAAPRASLAHNLPLFPPVKRRPAALRRRGADAEK